MIKGIINNATAIARRQVMVVMGLVVDQEPWRSTDPQQHTHRHATRQDSSVNAQIIVQTIGSS
jgi:hypothetical protein